MDDAIPYDDESQGETMSLDEFAGANTQMAWSVEGYPNYEAPRRHPDLDSDHRQRASGHRHRPADHGHVDRSGGPTAATSSAGTADVVRLLQPESAEIAGQQRRGDVHAAHPHVRHLLDSATKLQATGNVR